MLNENAKLWVEALRSGKYEQCVQMLHKADNGYCCLGVACEVFIKAGNNLNVAKGVLNTWGEKDIPAIKYNGEVKVLPRVVQAWLGLSRNNGQFDSDDENGTLASMNDNGKTFSEIADFIESEPGTLFE